MDCLYVIIFENYMKCIVKFSCYYSSWLFIPLYLYLYQICSESEFYLANYVVSKFSPLVFFFIIFFYNDFKLLCQLASLKNNCYKACLFFAYDCVVYILSIREMCRQDFELRYWGLLQRMQQWIVESPRRCEKSFKFHFL